MRRGRWVLLAIAVAIVPACRGDKFVAASLFTEQFNGSFPGTSWTALTGTATAALDGTAGNPAPSLKMSTTTAASSVQTETTASFSNPSLTLSVHMANLAASAAEAGTGTISILNATPAVVASASWNNVTGQITFTISGATDAVVTAPARDGNFHRIVFNVSSAGTATWSLDNGALVITRLAFPSGMLKVRLDASFGAGTAWPSFFYDFVNVTSP